MIKNKILVIVAGVWLNQGMNCHFEHNEVKRKISIDAEIPLRYIDPSFHSG